MLLCPFRVGNADPETFFQMMVQRMGFELFCSGVMIELAERAALGPEIQHQPGLGELLARPSSDASADH